MKFLAVFILSIALCLIGVESVDLAKFLFPEGFNAAVKLDRQKRAQPGCSSSTPTVPTDCSSPGNYFFKHFHHVY